MSAKEGQSTGTFNSVVFHTNSAVDFGSDTVSDVSMRMSVTVSDRGERVTLIHFNTPFSSCFTKDCVR